MENHLEEIEFINAAGAVFAWMCISDGKITVEEADGFSNYLNELPYAKNISQDEFVTAYSEILHAFEVDFEDGYNRTLVRVEGLKSNKKIATELVRVARRAMATDEDLEDVEENVLRELCSILEIEEEDIS